jgi:hypothetical protein
MAAFDAIKNPHGVDSAKVLKKNQAVGEGFEPSRGS